MEKWQKKLLWIPVILALLTLTAMVINAVIPDKHILTGEVDARQIDIAAKIPGRIDSIFVKEGDVVKKGDILVRLKSPEIEAKYEQAQGAVQAAKAMLDMALNGARSEEVKAAFELYDAARAQFEYAEKSYKRMKSLYEEHIISKQMFDEMEFKYNAARAKMIAAQQKYEMAKKGARKEQIEAAEGQYKRALNALKEVEAFMEETNLRAPQNGEIDNIIADPGEVIAAGYPIVSLVDLNDIWISVFVPETQLKYFQKDKTFDVVIPAISENKTFRFKVSFIKNVGYFATRRASNEKGSFDIKTFEVRLRSIDKIEGLKPGMSARIALN